MNTILMVSSIVIIVCIFFSNLSHKLGLPIIIAFIGLGMFFGSDGLIKISFDNYVLAEKICTTALIFIMFYGGFGTKWSEAKPIAIKATLLSTLGVVITAGLTGGFCHYVLHIGILESLLIGAVISSTDAASVFSILRSRRLNLKERTASMLEMESGSNDPCSYMLTVIVLVIMGGTLNTDEIAYTVFSQLVYGILIGASIAYFAALLLKKYHFANEGFDAAFIFAVAVLSYALSSTVGGNGYLTVYIVGIYLGNQPLKNKKSLVHFFDALTGLMQILIFFLLGLLSFPSQLPAIVLPALAITLFLTFIARPLAVFLLLTPARCSLAQQLLVSWTGLRGAASIVFAIMATTSATSMNLDIFHIVFCITLFSLIFQGTCIPFVARKLGMIDDNDNVMKTFNDYSDEIPLQFVKLTITSEHPWMHQYVKNIALPPKTLFVLLLRGQERIIPHGNSIIYEKDMLVLCHIY